MTDREEKRKAARLQYMQERQFVKRLAEYVLGQPDCPNSWRAWAERKLDDAATEEAREQEAKGDKFVDGSWDTVMQRGGL